MTYEGVRSSEDTQRRKREKIKKQRSREKIKEVEK